MLTKRDSLNQLCYIQQRVNLFQWLLGFTPSLSPFLSSLKPLNQMGLDPQRVNVLWLYLRISEITRHKELLLQAFDIKKKCNYRMGTQYSA